MATILIVDDNSTNREYLVAVLGAYGHRLLEAPDAADAMAKARLERPHLIICDIVMPKVDGYELVRRLRSDPLTSSLPVMFYTGEYKPEEVSALMAAGGVLRLLEKPAEPLAILEAVGDILDNSPRPATAAPASVGMEFESLHRQLLIDKLAAKVAQLEQEIAERKRSEEALSASEARLRATIDGAIDAIVTIDEAGIVQSINPSAVATFGYEIDEIVSQSVRMLMPESQRSRYDAYFRHYLRREKRGLIGRSYETEGRRKDGSFFPMELTVSEVQCNARRLFVGFIRDLTERRLIEARVQKLHAGPLNAVGGMAAALAHEINQPLLATATYLKAARRLLRFPVELRPASVEDTLDNAAAQIMRAGRIVNHLREFGARGEPDKTVQRLHDLINEVYEHTIASARQADVRFILQLFARNDRIVADRIQIKQILVNLVRNAIEAMNVSIKRELTISTSTIEEDMIRTDVADTGAGLSEEVKSDLFESFTTTKTNGMGVGLSISRSIVEAHYGKIWAESPPGGGAILSFTLPLAEAETVP